MKRSSVFLLLLAMLFNIKAYADLTPEEQAQDMQEAKDQWEHLKKTSKQVIPVGPDDETIMREAIARKVHDAWERSDFETLEALGQNYIRTRAKTPSGKWRLSVYHDTMTALLKIEWPREWDVVQPSPIQCFLCRTIDPAHYIEADRRWDILNAKIGTWVAHFPKSSVARVVQARYLMSRGWFYRGGGFADEVPNEAWPIFKYYLEAACNTLQTTRSYSKVNPVWYQLMMQIATAQGWSESKKEELLQDFYRNGQSYAPTYQQAADGLMPKWGGSYEALDEFARDAIVHASSEGVAIYTRIYWNISEDGSLREKLFLRSNADWSLMRRGFEEMTAKYPSPKNLNGMAMFACVAGDAKVYKETLKRLGDKLNTIHWFTGYGLCEDL